MAPSSPYLIWVTSMATLAATRRARCSSSLQAPQTSARKSLSRQARPVRPGAPRTQRHFNFVSPGWPSRSAENICPPHRLTSTSRWGRSAVRTAQRCSCRASNFPHLRSMHSHPHAPQPNIARSVRYRPVTRRPRPRYKPHRATRCLLRRQQATRTGRRQSF